MQLFGTSLCTRTCSLANLLYAFRIDRRKKLSEMENSQDSTLDRISNLPEELITRILTYLPLSDAARTSILATSWMNNWRYIPNLEFDNFRVGNQSADSVLRRIGQIVAAHRRPIRKFSLYLHGPFSYPEVHPVINHVLQSGVQEFTLMPSVYQRDTLPMEFYSHILLTFLDLANCHFEPPNTFIGFPRLTSLLLSDVSITSDVLNSLISNCPLLEILDIESRNLVGSVEIIAPTLNCLTFRAPLRSIRLVNAPLLKRVVLSVGLPLNFRLFREQRFPDLIDFHSCLHVTETLQVDHFYLEGLTAAHAFDQGAFVCVDTLHLTGLLFDLDDVLSTLALTRNCPNLRELTITIHYIWPRDDIRDIQRLNEEYGSTTFTFDNLKDIKIHSLTGSLLEMEFIKFVLARSPVLQTMTLIPDSDACTHQIMHIQRELGQFFQLSQTANIILEQQMRRFQDFNRFF